MMVDRSRIVTALAALENMRAFVLQGGDWDTVSIRELAAKIDGVIKLLASTLPEPTPGAVQALGEALRKASEDLSASLVGTVADGYAGLWDDEDSAL